MMETFWAVCGSLVSIGIDVLAVLLLAGGACGVAVSQTQPVIVAGPMITLSCSAILAGVVILCRWRRTSG